MPIAFKTVLMNGLSPIFRVLGLRSALAGPVSAQQPTVKVATPARLSPAEQWARLTGILKGSIDRAEGTQKLQSAASQQLDLAQYALSNLIDELSAVMAIPGRRGPASVHVFEPSAARASSHALAA